MSEFKTPQSRNEAILQNILGASNVLVSPQSRVEAILQAILNETEYNEPAQSRIEEILLAILNGDDYDGEGYSRNEKILIAGLKGEEWTEAPQSRIEELLIEWANSGLSVEWLIYSGTNTAVLHDTLERPVKSFTFFGKSSKLNQLFSLEQSDWTAYHATMTATGSKVLYKVDTNSGRKGLVMPVKKGHTYLVLGSMIHSETNYGCYIGVYSNFATNAYQDRKAILYSSEETNDVPLDWLFTPNDDNMEFGIALGTNFDTTKQMTFANPMIIDITDSEHDYTTASEFHVDFPADYYPYSETNKILSAVNPKAVISDGDENSKTIAATITLRAVGTAKDTIVVRSDGTGKLTQNIESVDAGTLRWGTRTEYTNLVFIVTEITGRKNATPILCEKYKAISSGIAAFGNGANYDKMMAYHQTGSGIFARDSDYTTSTGFKNSMNGIKLLYILLNPIETELTAEEVAAILNGAKTYSPNTTINASNDDKITQDFEIEYAHKAGAGA